MNQTSSTSEIKLSETELFVYKNYRNCPIHPKRQLTFLSTSTDSKSKYHLQCADCIPYRKENQSLISLLTLMESEKKTIFKSWPIQDDSQIYDKLVETSLRKPFAEEKQNQISAYFKQLRAEIENMISDKEKEMLIHCDSLWDLNEQVIHQYNQAAAKDELKDIIYNKKDDFEQQNKLLAESISRILNNQERNKQAILDSIAHLADQEKVFNFEEPERIKNIILLQIKEIDMFVIKNIDEIKLGQIDRNLNFYKNELHKVAPKEMTTSQLMVKLMSNDVTNCSQELLDQLQRIIARISLYLDKIDVQNLINEDLLNPYLNTNYLVKLQKEQSHEVNYLTEFFLKVTFFYQYFYQLFLKQQNQDGGRFPLLINYEEILIKKIQKYFIFINTIYIILDYNYQQHNFIFWIRNPFIKFLQLFFFSFEEEKIFNSHLTIYNYHYQL